MSPTTPSIDIILVSPRNPLNIGAVARAMANFGFAHLTVVAPYAPHWREARSAVGAPDLLATAIESASLAEAVAGCTLVLGTGTLAHRKPEQRVIPLPELTPIVQHEFARGGRIALVFGPEKHGLTRNDLSWCHSLVAIPTDRRQPSMNLGQAVAVCLYELSSRRLLLAEPGSTLQTPSENDTRTGKQAPAPAGRQTPAAPSASLDLLAGVIEQTMAAARYSPSSMQAANRHDLRLLLRRLTLSQHDTRRILGLFRRILWRLGQSGPQK